MDINLLVVNVGNSRTALGVFEAGALTHVARIPHDQRDQWAEAIKTAWERIAGKDGAAIAAASVNPHIAEPLEHVIEQTLGVKAEWVGRQLDLPISVLTDQPAQTGVDRVLNVAAAFEQMGHACAVVDAGTAVTVDFCDDRGAFVGGAIAPGARMMLQSLHEKTARLPAVELAAPRDASIGRNTEQAMLQGVFHGIRGMVRDLIEQYATELGRWPDLIATGGDAALLFGAWELPHAISPDLILYGIALAYAQHHIKHET